MEGKMEGLTKEQIIENQKKELQKLADIRASIEAVFEESGEDKKEG